MVKKWLSSKGFAYDEVVLDKDPARQARSGAVTGRHA